MERSQKTEDYMKLIYNLRKNGSVRGAYIARELKVAKPTVSDSLKRMETAGLISINYDRTIELTKEGEAIAESVIGRNRVIFELLTVLGVDTKTAEDDACRMEHEISDETLRAFTDLLQYLRFVKQITIRYASDGFITNG